MLSEARPRVTGPATSLAQAGPTKATAALAFPHTTRIALGASTCHLVELVAPQTPAQVPTGRRGRANGDGLAMVACNSQHVAPFARRESHQRRSAKAFPAQRPGEQACAEAAMAVPTRLEEVFRAVDLSVEDLVEVLTV